jgi:methenyltetrahydromethanopterin cyclohydrolase
MPKDDGVEQKVPAPHFYKIDPMLFRPAEIVLCNLQTGRAFAFGRTKADVLYQSFFG